MACAMREEVGVGVQCHDSPSPMDVETDEVCWICLDDNQETDPFVQPCKCPRKVHPKCLARWQLQQAGRPEETHCRFCNSTLADWKASLTPDPLKPEVQKVQPIMVVYFEGEIHRIPVKQGPDGLKEFTTRIRELFRLPEDVDISLTFGCKEPMSGQHLKLEGIGAFDAAVHCASVAAAERQHKLKGVPGAPGSRRGTASTGGGGGPLASVPSAPAALQHGNDGSDHDHDHDQQQDAHHQHPHQHFNSGVMPDTPDRAHPNHGHAHGHHHAHHMSIGDAPYSSDPSTWTSSPAAPASNPHYHNNYYGSPGASPSGSDGGAGHHAGRQSFESETCAAPGGGGYSSPQAMRSSIPVLPPPTPQQEHPMAAPNYRRQPSQHSGGVMHAGSTAAAPAPAGVESPAAYVPQQTLPSPFGSSVNQHELAMAMAMQQGANHPHPHPHQHPAVHYPASHYGSPYGHAPAEAHPAAQHTHQRPPLVHMHSANARLGGGGGGGGSGGFGMRESVNSNGSGSAMQVSLPSGIPPLHPLTHAQHSSGMMQYSNSSSLQYAGSGQYGASVHHHSGQYDEAAAMAGLRGPRAHRMEVDELDAAARANRRFRRDSAGIARSLDQRGGDRDGDHTASSPYGAPALPPMAMHLNHHHLHHPQQMQVQVPVPGHHHAHHQSIGSRPSAGDLPASDEAVAVGSLTGRLKFSLKAFSRKVARSLSLRPGAQGGPEGGAGSPHGASSPTLASPGRHDEFVGAAHHHHHGHHDHTALAQ